jgi:hypothetical protein
MRRIMVCGDISVTRRFKESSRFYRSRIGGVFAWNVTPPQLPFVAVLLATSPLLLVCSRLRKGRLGYVQYLSHCQVLGIMDRRTWDFRSSEQVSAAILLMNAA